MNLWECNKLIASEASGPQKTLKMGLGGNFTFCGYGWNNVHSIVQLILKYKFDLIDWYSYSKVRTLDKIYRNFKKIFLQNGIAFMNDASHGTDLFYMQTDRFWFLIGCADVKNSLADAR